MTISDTVALMLQGRKVIAAAKEANAYNFIMSLPNGFENRYRTERY